MMSAQSLPEIVSDSVSSHFREHSREIEDSIRSRIEDVQLKLLDKFFKNIQVSYSQRIAALEETARINNETLQQIQGYSERAEHDLQRLEAGIRGLIGDSSEPKEVTAVVLRD